MIFISKNTYIKKNGSTTAESITHRVVNVSKSEFIPKCS